MTQLGTEQIDNQLLAVHVNGNFAPVDLDSTSRSKVQGNALEECCLISPNQKPCIKVSIHSKSKMLSIKVENPLRMQSVPKLGKIHGYGLKNVQRCVDKYNSEFQTDVQDDLFHFFVLLNMK